MDIEKAVPTRTRQRIALKSQRYYALYELTNTQILVSLVRGYKLMIIENS